MGDIALVMFLSQGGYNPWNYIIPIITSLLGMLGMWLYGAKGKSIDKHKEVELAKIEVSDEEKELLRKEIKELKAELEMMKLEKIEMERKFETIKHTFRIVLNQYARIFRDNPEDLEMLRDISNILNEL